MIANSIIELSNHKNLIITKAHVADAPLVLDFLNRIGGETDHLTFGLNEFSVSLDDQIELIDKNITEDFQLMLIGKINDEIVSQLFLSRSSNQRLLHIGEIGLSVSKKYWGLSIGSHMLAWAISWAKHKNLVKLHLQVRVDNKSAVKLYEKFGFLVEGMLKKSIKIQDHFYDEYVMGLLLR